MRKSIFEKVTFKHVLFFCLFLIIMNIWEIVTFITKRDIYSMPFISISAGLLLIAIAIFVSYRTQEKIAVGALGVSFIIDWLGDIKFISIPLSSSIAILFEMGTIYFYWLSYKTKSNDVAIKIKPKLLLLIIILLLILVAPALFFWIMGILH